MKQIMNFIQYSPLNPPENSGQALKGRIATNFSLTKITANTPLRGLGVI